MQKYASISQISDITGLSVHTVRSRRKAIETGIQMGRYNQYAISGRLISVPVFLDANKYYDYLSSPGFEDLIPAFNEMEAKKYL